MPAILARLAVLLPAQCFPYFPLGTQIEALNLMRSKR
jgi:hypothetical protein